MQRTDPSYHRLLNPIQFKTEQNAAALSSGFSFKILSNSGELLGNNILPARYLKW